ncbi:MAG: energy transducer TonB [Bacteroidia bacterium]
MKKSILILSAVLTLFSLTAFGYMSWDKTEAVPKAITCSNSMAVAPVVSLVPYKKAAPDLLYKIDSRFLATITREDLLHATSIIDILPEQESRKLNQYANVKVTVMSKGLEFSKAGHNEMLTEDQLKLLESTDYSTNFYIKADCQMAATCGMVARGYDLSYYFTITPEKEAEFADGYDALIGYLKENSEAKTILIEEEKLKPGKVHFIVTKEGTVADVSLQSTCGYDEVDKTLVELISNMPAKWNPATNAEGEKVDQELVFFFGTEGC